ncbi:hypothetical protein [Streptomyces sp. NPDC047939]|uniref:hypothetical protein n=1 Tax=Streptomyces sp. NPDC047939 TaxID=3155381 RepID=UPI00341DEA93
MQTETQNADLRGRLIRQRRERLARNGSLGPTIKALHDVATLMELSTLTIYRRGQMRTDYQLIMRACYGPLMRRNHKTGRYEIKPLRTHRAERSAANLLMDEVVKALGSEYGHSIAEVRTIADRMAVEAMAVRNDAT